MNDDKEPRAITQGTIALTRIHRGQNRQLVVTISSTELALLEWTKNTAGVGKITTKRTSSPHHSPGYTYCVANRQALDVLAQVQRNGKYTAMLLQARRTFEQLFSAISIRGRTNELQRS